jgi:catechol 2,3-dioxygenase-like lactoylglutathione lyase family enzyme
MYRAFLLSLVTLFASLPAFPEPVAEQDRVGIDFRRTTLVVRDIDTSLAFYRDALGLEVIYDNLIRTPRSAESDAEADRSLRLVFLRANDDYVGIVGLLQYRKPEKPALHQGAEPFSTGSVVLLFNSENLDDRFAKARNVPGVRVLQEPERTEYPSYDGSGTIAVNVSVLTDPDGFVVELNQLLQDLH